MTKKKIYSIGFKTIPDIKGKTEQYPLYIKASAWFNARKSLLQEKLLNKDITEFYKQVDTNKINNQLNSIIPGKVLTPLTIYYKLKDQALAAKLFF